MQTKRYFAAQSAHGSETSMGFSNDTDVYVFTSRRSRDQFVNESKNMSCVAIKFRDVTKCATNWSCTHNCEIKPNTFTGEFWGIDATLVDSDIDNCIGIVCVCSPHDTSERLYK